MTPLLRVAPGFDVVLTLPLPLLIPCAFSSRLAWGQCARVGSARTTGVVLILLSSEGFYKGLLRSR
jgi:hypothetical protein